MLDIDNLVTLAAIVLSILGSVKIYTMSEYRKARMEEDYIAERQKVRVEADLHKAQIEANVYQNDVATNTSEGGLESLLQEVMKNPEMMKEGMKYLGMKG